MSNQITTAMINSYSSNVTSTYQQSDSKFRGSVHEEPMKALLHFFERVEPTAAVKKTVRHGPTPIVESVHSRRATYMADYEWADLVDPQDELRILIDPQSAYTQNAVKALNRAYDDVVIKAFDGAALTGADGSTTLAFTGGASEDNAGDEDYTSAALTLQNLVDVKQDLDDLDIPDEGRYIAMPPSGFSQLLKQTGAGTPTVSNIDYNSVKALVRGEINSILGFTFIRSTRMPVSTGTQRYCFAWHRDSLGIAVGQAIKTMVSVRDDLSYAVQVYACMTLGAVRLQKGIVRFEIDEAN